MPDVLIIPPSSASVQLKQVLLGRMAAGYYPVGSKLPSVREIAESLGINRNTVSKVYRELAREGVTRTVAGKGVFVQRRPDERGRDKVGRSELAHEIAELAQRARLYGLSQSSFLELVSQTLAESYHARNIAFVECSTADTVQLAHDIGLHLGEKVDPVPLADLQKHPQAIACKYDLICTTFYHLAEIHTAIPEAEHKTFALQVTPCPEVLLKLTGYTTRHRLGVVVANQRTLESVLRIIQAYCPASVDAVVLSGRSRIAFPHKVDAVVDTLSTHDLVLRQVKKVPQITITYRPDGETLEEIRRLLESGSLENRGTLTLEDERRSHSAK